MNLILYAGAFKPMHPGHVSALAQAMKAYPMGRPRLLISEKERDGWDSSAAVATVRYFFPGTDVEYIVLRNPVKYAIDHALANAQVVLVTSAKDAGDRFATIPRTQVFLASVDPHWSGTDLRRQYRTVREYLTWLSETTTHG